MATWTVYTPPQRIDHDGLLATEVHPESHWRPLGIMLNPVCTSPLERCAKNQKQVQKQQRLAARDLQ
jgi:hypothetical protein